ncbi:MAG: PKD domain-containing protein [Bacteroidales bacterium]
MKKQLNFLILFLGVIFFAGAQNIPLSISGHVTDDSTGYPIQNHLVMVTIESGGMTMDYEFITNDAGYYGSDSIPTVGQGFVSATTFDCMGIPRVQEATFNPGNLSIVFDFNICGGIMPPDDCENGFWYETWNMMDFTFIGESMPPADYYYWDFGDGNTGYGQTVDHSYNIIDMVYVTLTTFVFDPATGDSCVASSTQEVWVGNNGGDCQANFEYTIDSTPMGAYIAQFTDLSIGNPDFYMWEFGDGQFSEEQNPEHIYYEQGTYMVCLTIFSDSMNNCYDTYCEEIVIGSGGIEDCENWFWYETFDNITFNFFGESMPLPADNYFWDFGDGNTGFGQQITHSYDPNAGGVFIVTLTTISNVPGTADTCIATSNQEVWVGNGGGECIANFDFTIDSVPAGGYLVQFSDLSIGNPTYWMWEFGDGSFSEEQNPTHLYTLPGSYFVCLTISSDSMNNCFDTYCENVIIDQGGIGDCENWFWYDTFDNITFNFFGESVPFPADNFFWDFGDGNTGFGQGVTHTYDPAAGEVFLVSLTTFAFDPVTGDSCIAYSLQEVWVGGQSNDCENWFWYDSWDFVTFEFFGESFPIPANDYFWDFGDGTTAYGQQVQHTFDPGPNEFYLVTLTTFAYVPGTADTCVATSVQEVWVGGQGNDCENFFWYESFGDFTFDFMGESFPMPAEEYIWDFGDGGIAYGQMVTHTFDPALGDDFVVCLTTYSYDPIGDSCVAESCQEIFLGGQMGYELFGMVMVDNAPVDYALVGLFGMENGESYIYDFTMTDENSGSYFFENVPEGDYYIWASLLPISDYYFQYFPTYFGDALFWFDADLVSLGEPNNPYNINLLPAETFNTGPGNITGTINFDNGKGPADNITIVLMDENENPITYIQSDELGLFEFEELAYGTYKLKIEIPGVSSEVGTVVLSVDNQEVEIDFVIKGTSAYLSVSDLSLLVSGISDIYPNPVSNAANMEINVVENTDVVIQIFNQMGQEVYNSEISLNSGKQLLKVSTSELVSGFYTLQITGQNGGSVYKKFIVGK